MPKLIFELKLTPLLIAFEVDIRLWNDFEGPVSPSLSEDSSLTGSDPNFSDKLTEYPEPVAIFHAY